MSEVDRAAHWQQVYSTRDSREVSWFQATHASTLELIAASGVSPAQPVIDVGGGASTLVDALVERGFSDVTVLDVSPAALDVARARLGERGRAVHWVAADVTSWAPTRRYSLWHDRAVFHFLTDAAARAAYLAQVHRSVKPGGHVMVATFGLDGPERCSGLPVARYDAAGIHAVFGDAFVKVDEASEVHATPWGSSQAFVYCFCRRA